MAVIQEHGDGLAPPPILGGPYEVTTPETEATLRLQQTALIAGHRPVQMFPNGTSELDLPMGCARIKSHRGVFHFNPQQISARTILLASAHGRENEILGLGPYSKSDVIASGQPLVAVVERDPHGTEVLTSVAAASWAREVAKEMACYASPENTVTIELPEIVIRDRLAGRR